MTDKTLEAISASLRDVTSLRDFLAALFSPRVGKIFGGRPAAWRNG
jgi:hypothetical protein